MNGVIRDLKQIAKHNTFFRQVVETGTHLQVVVMSIPQGDDIGAEVHPDTDQFLYLIKGTGSVVLGSIRHHLNKHDAVLVPAGVTHNIINEGEEPLQIITLYGPAHHPAGTVHKTKAESMHS